MKTFHYKVTPLCNDRGYAGIMHIELFRIPNTNTIRCRNVATQRITEHPASDFRNIKGVIYFKDTHFLTPYQPLKPSNNIVTPRRKPRGV